MPVNEKNEEIAAIFNEMADILDIQKVEWKPRAYRTAARAIWEVRNDLKSIYKKGGLKALEEIPGVGEGIGKKIVEYIKTGKIKEHEKLKKSIPSGLKAIMDVPGMGPKKAYVLYKKLNIKTIADLKRAIKERKVENVFGFGIKSEERIKESISMHKTHKERQPIEKVLPIANKIIAELKKLKEVQKIYIAGSIRRKERTVGDIDILAVSRKPAIVMDKFTTLPVVKKVIAKGMKKSVVILKNNMQADIRVFENKSFGAAMHYFTGNKMHNIELRRIAIKKGYKFNEYGLFKGKKMIAGRTEKEIYSKLGLRYIPPEKRKNTGEIEKAMI